MIDKNGYYAGGGMLSPDGKIFYLNIPKNASTYLTNLLKANNWKHCNILENLNGIEQTIAFLRDPVDRWISGISTYLALKVLGIGYGSDHFIEDYNQFAERIIFNQITFDDHTESQCTFLKQIKTFPINYFELDNIIANLNSFCKTDITSNSEIDNNSSEQNYDTKQISLFIRQQIEKSPELKAKIVNHYLDDYKLINNIRFYSLPRL